MNSRRFQTACETYCERTLIVNSPSEKTQNPIKRRFSLRDYVGPAPGALKDHINSVELSRITITALTAGGGTLALLQAILMNVGTIFPAPADAALAAVILTFTLESLRRLGHGEEQSSSRSTALHHPGGNGDTGRRFRIR
jgi:hypothetical protein